MRKLTGAQRFIRRGGVEFITSSVHPSSIHLGGGIQESEASCACGPGTPTSCLPLKRDGQGKFGFTMEGDIRDSLFPNSHSSNSLVAAGCTNNANSNQVPSTELRALIFDGAEDPTNDVAVPEYNATACKQALQSLCSSNFDGQKADFGEVLGACRHSLPEHFQGQAEACQASAACLPEPIVKDAMSAEEADLPVGEQELLLFYSGQIRCEGDSCDAGLLVAAS